MDYTKILSALRRVKDALEKKIDAVNASVSGLPNTLDAQFTAVKNDIATVKTDVSNVKADTDINLPQKFDAGNQEIKTELKSTTEQIKTSIAESMAHIANEETLPYLRKSVYLKSTNDTETKCVDVRGKGYLNYALIEGVGQLRVIIDDHSFVFLLEPAYKKFAGFLDKNEIIGSGSDSSEKALLFSETVDIGLSNNRNVAFLNRVDFVKGKSYEDGTLTLSNGKIQFNEHLEVFFKMKTSSSLKCHVSYELY